MGKQLSLSIYETRKQYKITKKNEKNFKKLYADMYELDMIPKDLYLKVQTTNYVRG